MVQITSLFDTLRGALGSYRFAISSSSLRTYSVNCWAPSKLLVAFLIAAAAAADAASGDDVADGRSLVVAVGLMVGLVFVLLCVLL